MEEEYYESNRVEKEHEKEFFFYFTRFKGTKGEVPRDTEEINSGWLVPYLTATTTLSVFTRS